MLRTVSLLVLVAASLAAASCRTSLSEGRRTQVREGALIQRSIKDYRVIVAGHGGKVGYLKVYDVTEGGSVPYEWKYVYDRNWRELGFIDQFGGATMYHYYTPAEQAQQNRELRATRLPSDSLESNVLRMLGIDPSTDDVTFPVATKADITGDSGMHLAGPGIVPSKAPTIDSK